jgi:RNA polymerase sigma factor (sigma-70 family)
VVQDAAVRAGSAAEVELASLYRDEGARLWRALVAYGGNRDIASDAVAEAFAQALARSGEIRSPLPWLWKTAFRIATRELRASRKAAREAVPPSYEMPEPLEDVLRALAQLSPNQRAAIVLHDYADRPTKEVADTLGMSAATVRVHLSQGRRRLRSILEVHDE